MSPPSRMHTSTSLSVHPILTIFPLSQGKDASARPDALYMFTLGLVDSAARRSNLPESRTVAMGPPNLGENIMNSEYGGVKMRLLISSDWTKSLEGA